MGKNRPLQPDALPSAISRVIGPPRSGTTLVGYLLAGLPDVLSLSEPHLAWDVMPTWKLHRFFRRLRREIGLADLAPPFRGNHGRFERFLGRLAHRSGYGHLVTKETWRTELTPSWCSAPLLRRLQAAAPESTALLIRDPADTAASTIRLMRFTTGIVGRLAALRWPGLPLFASQDAIVRWAAGNWCDFLDWAGQLGQTPLRYEDLVRTPKKTVPVLCGRLGLDYDPAMLDLRDRPGGFGGLGDPGLMARRPRRIDASAIGRGARLTARQRAIVRETCAAHAGRLGYDLA